MHFLRPLRYDDVFDFTIWMVNWQRVRGTRCFELTRKDNRKVIAQGTQHIVYMDTKTGRPTNLPEEEIAKFRLEDPRVFPYERFPKVVAVEKSFVTQRQVEWMDLDVYNHVNNVIYVNYAEEALAQGFAAQGWSPVKLTEAGLSVVTKRVHIQYVSTASWGETLNISTHPLEVKETGGSSYIGMVRVDGYRVAQCIMDWELVDRTNGQARSLPDGLR
jgi:YbgC/YbaW family acyl-CoA thioester hydrolase